AWLHLFFLHDALPICALLSNSVGQERRGRYCPVAALNLTTSSAGTRPRSLTSMPWALAHSRTSVVFRASGWALRPLRAGRLVLRSEEHTSELQSRVDL